MGVLLNGNEDDGSIKVKSASEGVHLCDGDSGGAIQYVIFGRINEIFGLARSGNRLFPGSHCNDENQATNVTSHLGWIEPIVFEDFWWTRNEKI